MSNCEKVCDVLLGILINAGYEIDVNNLDGILGALSDYEEKHNEMLEHILMQGG